MHYYIFILFVASVQGRVADKKHDDAINSLLTNDKSTDRVKIDIADSRTPGNPRNTKFTNNEIRKTSDSDNCINDTAPCVTENTVENGTVLLLTPYLKAGKVKQARLAAKVDSKYFMGMKSYSGFLTVDEKFDSNLFFWYFPVLNGNVETTPWMIWLQGGPGASSLIGLFQEIGPFSSTNGNLRPNPFTWLRNHSLLFIDNPVGTGYSFTNHTDGYATNMTAYSSQLYLAVMQFLQIFPELERAPLFVAGESYAGKYVPALAMEIHRRKEVCESNINLQGIILGNSYVEPDQISHMPSVLQSFGLIEKEQLELVQPLVDSLHEAISANKSVEAKEAWTKIIAILLFLTHQTHGYNFLRDRYSLDTFVPYLTAPGVAQALHVGSQQFWPINLTVHVALAPDFLSTTRPKLETLLEHYRVLVYCGQLDLMLPCVHASESYRRWQWSGALQFLEASRYPYILNERLFGYYKSGGNLTEVIVRGAGHMAALDAPLAVWNMVSKWTSRQPISKQSDLYGGSYVEEFVRNNSLVFL